MSGDVVTYVDGEASGKWLRADERSIAFGRRCRTRDDREISLGAAYAMIEKSLLQRCTRHLESASLPCKYIAVEC